MLVNVSDSERETEKLKNENDELRARLHDLKIDSEAVSGEKQVDNLLEDEEIIEMKNKISV